jgi:ABC-type microcin C transport system permease subunit YejB
MSTNLYHKEIYLPKALYQFCPVGEHVVEYSNHAIQSAKSDRYGIITLNTTLELRKEYIIEVETENNRVSKVLYRMPYNNQFDVMIALIPNTFLVKTCWLNCKSDKHFTLDKLRYCSKI